MPLRAKDKDEDKEEGKLSSPFFSALREPIVKHLKSLVGKPTFIPAMDAALGLEGADLVSHIPLLIEAMRHHASPPRGLPLSPRKRT